MAEEKDTAPTMLYVKLSEHKPPEFKEKKGTDWVLFGTSADYKNNYPQYLIDLYNRSSKHKALVDGKCDFVNGRGWVVEVKDVEATVLTKVSQFMKSPNDFQTLKKLSKKLVFDSERFGGYYVELIYTKRGKRQIASVSHIPFQYIRTNEDKSVFYYTEDWSKRNPEKNEDFKTFPAFDPKGKEPVQLLAVDNSNSEGVYPLPPYLSANSYIESDIEIANFHLNNIKNGFSGGYMINFYNSNPTDTVKKEIEKALANKHTGSDNAGRFILNFASSRDKGAEIIPITPNNLDKQFAQLNDQVRAEIMIAHKVINPALFGVSSEGGLGNNADELAVAHSAFQSRYATPRQEDLEDVINGITSINGMPSVLSIKELEPITKPVDGSVKMSLMTKAEQREMLGLPVLDEEQSAGGVADLLGALPPLVATRVLEEMSSAEVRGLIGLQGASTEPKVTSSTTSTFSDMVKTAERQELLMSHLETNGDNPEDYEILSVKEIDFDNDADFLAAHDSLKLNFAVIDGLSDNDLKVLSALGQNPQAGVDELAQATQLTEDTVINSIESLKTSGAIQEVSGENGEIERQPTADGIDSIEAEPQAEIFVRYRYALRSDAPSLLTKSRDFCSRLMTANLLYSKDQIDAQSNGMGTDVWSTRGGYLNNHVTGRTQKSCRHIWQQVIVRPKN